MTKVECPYCGSTRAVIKYGRSHGKRQRYYCKICRRTFVPNDGVGSQKGAHVVALALDLYFRGLSLRKVSDHLANAYGIYVHHTTILRWIQRYAKLISEFVNVLDLNLSGTWYADEMSIKVGGKWRWLWNVMDGETRFLIASIITSERETEDAIRVLKEAYFRANRKPEVVITDGLHAYREAIKKVFGSLRRGGPRHVRHVRWEGDIAPTNIIERLQGTVREREKVMRGLKTEGTMIIEGFRIHYNFARPHEGLNGKTPAEAAGQDYFGKGKEAWLKLIKEAIMWQILNRNSKV